MRVGGVEAGAGLAVNLAINGAVHISIIMQLQSVRARGCIRLSTDLSIFPL